MQAVPAVPGRPGWKARLARTLGLDGNPLRRASDRAEAWIRAGLLVVFLTAGPLAALVAGQWTAHAAAAGTSGRVTGAPPAGGSTAAPVLVAIMTLAVTALALLIVLRLIQRLLDWRRLATWEAAWRATGPRWTDHRS